MKLIVLVVHGRDPPDGIPPVAKEGRNKGRISNAKMFPLTNTRIPSINIAKVEFNDDGVLGGLTE